MDIFYHKGVKCVSTLYASFANSYFITLGGFELLEKYKFLHNAACTTYHKHAVVIGWRCGEEWKGGTRIQYLFLLPWRWCCLPTASRVWERLRDEVSQNRSDRETLATCVGKFANSLAQVLFSWLQAQMRKRYHAGWVTTLRWAQSRSRNLGTIRISSPVCVFHAAV